MFRKTKELQSLVNASRKNLKDAERKVEDGNILIADLQKKNNEKAILGKIKELISDSESQN